MAVNKLLACVTTAIAIGVLGLGVQAKEPSKPCPPELNAELRQLHSIKTHNLCDFYRTDAPVLIVNTASHCGYTKQFEGLEALYRKYKDQGLVILGFPSNSFKQEEKSEEGTARVCYENYGVTFPMFEHIEVKGSGAHPVFRYLAKRSKEPEWNFNKYLLSDGKVEHFGSKITPTDSELEQRVIDAL